VIIHVFLKVSNGIFRKKNVKSFPMQDKERKEFYMSAALEEAHFAQRRGEVPVGAVVSSEGKILSRGHNQSISLHDATAHAEIIAIRNACSILQNYRLSGCDLYVTLEPCVMCVGAALQARLHGLYFGAYDPKTGACGSAVGIPFDKLNHQMEVSGGILEKECGQILKDFFKEKRG